MTFTSIWLLGQAKEQVQEQVGLRETYTPHPIFKEWERERERMTFTSIWLLEQVKEQVQEQVGLRQTSTPNPLPDSKLWMVKW